MYLLLVNLYEFGQFLRILLWISIPLIVSSMLVTTWLHYRRKRKEQDSLVLSMEGLDLSAPPEVLIAAMNGRPVMTKVEGEPSPVREAEVSHAEDVPQLAEEGEDTEHLYQGILWMKEKYEQYRDLADQKIFELKEQLRSAEQKYQDLLTAPHAVSPQLVQPALTSDDNTETSRTAEIESLHKKLEEKDRIIEELLAKLQNSSQLLLNISQELDRSSSTAVPNER